MLGTVLRPAGLQQLQAGSPPQLDLLAGANVLFADTVALILKLGWAVHSESHAASVWPVDSKISQRQESG